RGSSAQTAAVCLGQPLCAQELLEDSLCAAAILRHVDRFVLEGDAGEAMQLRENSGADSARGSERRLGKHEREHAIAQVGEQIRRAQPSANQIGVASELIAQLGLREEQRQAQRALVAQASGDLLLQSIQQSLSVERAGLWIDASRGEYGRGLAAFAAGADRPFRAPEQLQSLERLGDVVSGAQIQGADLFGDVRVR